MSSLFEKSEMSAALRHLLPAYHSRGCLSEYSLNHGLEDQIQNKNRVRPGGRTLPKATDDSDMYNRALPVGNALFLFVLVNDLQNHITLCTIGHSHNSSPP